MKIKYKNYTLIPNGKNFDLTKTVESEKRESKEKYKSEKELGYSMRFETCVEIIIKEILNDRDEVVTLRQYIDEYKELKQEILGEI